MTKALALTGPKNEMGLVQKQVDLLTEIAMTLDWEEAAQNLGLTRSQARALMRTPEFIREYDKFFTSDELELTKRELEMASSELGALYQDAMNAEMVQKVQVVCPCGCNNKFTVDVKVMDWPTRLKAGETLLKLTRLMKDEKSVKLEASGKVEHQHTHMSVADRMALMKLDMGLPLPPHIVARLQDMGLIPNGKTVIVDGEARVLDDTDGYTPEQ